MVLTITTIVTVFLSGSLIGGLLATGWHETTIYLLRAELAERDALLDAYREEEAAQLELSTTTTHSTLSAKE